MQLIYKIEFNTTNQYFKHIIEDLINDTLKWLPANNFDVNTISALLSARIEKMNEERVPCFILRHTDYTD